MRRHSAPVVIVLALGLVALVASAVFAGQHSRNFTAPLDSDQEVAEEPVESDATGVARFQLTRDGEALEYRLNVANIENVTMAHIHLGQREQNGPVVVWLYPEGPPPQQIDGRFQGVLAEGTITADDLVGQLEGASIDDLVGHIRSGNAYVNVHTQEHGGGEIRGQIDVPRGR